MAKKAQRKSLSVFGPTVITPVGRLVFPSIARAIAFQEGQEKKYSAMLVCNTSEQLSKLIAEIDSVGAKAFDADYQKESVYKPYTMGEQIIQKIVDGGKDPSEQVVDLYSKRIRLLAKGSEDKEAPRCYLPDKSLLPRRPGNEEDLKQIEGYFYPGSFCRLAVTPFSFVTGANRGVGLILKGIQFYKDGDRLGAVDLDSAFNEEFSDAGPWDEDSSMGFTDGDAEVNI